VVLGWLGMSILNQKWCITQRQRVESKRLHKAKVEWSQCENTRIKAIERQSGDDEEKDEEDDGEEDEEDDGKDDDDDVENDVNV